MFFRCCCCHIVLDCFIIKPRNIFKRRNKVKKVKWDYVETREYIIKLRKERP